MTKALTMFNQRTARGPAVCYFILTHPERLLLTEQKPLFPEADQNFIYLFIYFWLFKTSNVYVDKKKNSSKTSEI